jgi:hypothetical protein
MPGPSEVEPGPGGTDRQDECVAVTGLEPVDDLLPGGKRNQAPEGKLPVTSVGSRLGSSQAACVRLSSLTNF